MRENAGVCDEIIVLVLYMCVPRQRTFVGRGRAWLRLVVMQKKLADHFLTMSSHKAILRWVWPLVGRGPQMGVVLRWVWSSGGYQCA